MIEVLLERNGSGSLVRCKAEGHSEYAAKGFDIVCASVSVLMKTTLRMLEKTSGIELELDAPNRGFLSFEIKNTGLEEERLVFAGDFLVTGLEAVHEEFPDNLKLCIKYFEASPRQE